MTTNPTSLAGSMLPSVDGTRRGVGPGDGQDLPIACAPSAGDDLIERDGELATLARALAALGDRVGGVVTVKAPAGLGKTTLLERAAAAATAAGYRIRRAAPGPQERHFAYGVMRALLEAPVHAADEAERRRLLDGVAGQAGDLLLTGAVPRVNATASIAHSMLWLCAALTDGGAPMMLIVDDGHWADRPSLEVISYLARRVSDVPMLIVLAFRPDVPGAASDLLTLVGEGRPTSSVTLRPLTVAGSAELMRRSAPTASEEVCRRCHDAAHGNPWLVGELGHQIASHGPDSLTFPAGGNTPVRELAQDVIARRLAALARGDRAVSAALAVLGERSPPHVVAAVAGVSLDDVSAARDALAAAGLLDADHRGLAHALIAAAILESLPGAEAERLHHEAARTLAADGAESDIVAAHLLQSAPHADSVASAALWDAATNGTRRGAPHAAAAYLARALEERAPGDDRGQILAALAVATFDAGLPGARDRLREALDQIDDHTSRIDLLTRLATWYVLDADDDELSQLLDREVAADHGPDTHLALEVAALEMLITIPDRHAERAARLAAVKDDDGADPILARSVMAHRAWLATEVGTPDAATCARFARRALDGDLLLRDAGSRAGFHCCVRALIFTDHFTEAQAAIAAMREDPAVRGSLRLLAGAAWYAAELSQRTGQIADAENEARLALDLTPNDVNLFTGGAIEILVWALAERGAFTEAHALLDESGLAADLGRQIWEIGILHSRAVLALAEGDFPRAYDEAINAGRLRVGQGRPNPAWTPWRATASLALAHQGRRHDAAVLAAEELALAERFGPTGAILAATHAAAVAEPDDTRRRELCERALLRAGAPGSVLELSRIRLELGHALRRLGRRVDARQPLQLVLGDADRIGATLLAARARRELVATGLRPRRTQTEGMPSLTPRQRQVCELAATGTTNRAIAQQLFLSVKTVETHLAAAYEKLGVQDRESLVVAVHARGPDGP
jgi:DNA-binding CsgD family transcriptional regulator